VSFATITLCIASQQVFLVVSIYFVIDLVRKLLDTPSYSAFCFFLLLFQAGHHIILQDFHDKAELWREIILLRECWEIHRI
jgi:hypothetical protein